MAKMGVSRRVGYAIDDVTNSRQVDKHAFEVATYSMTLRTMRLVAMIKRTTFFRFRLTGMKRGKTSNVSTIPTASMLHAIRALSKILLQHVHFVSIIPDTCDRLVKPLLTATSRQKLVDSYVSGQLLQFLYQACQV